MRGVLAGLRRTLRGRLAREVAGRGAPRRALLLYSVDAFRRGPEHHQNVSQQRMLAAALAARGFAVDVADWDERSPRVLGGPYALVVDLHPVARPVYLGRLAPGAIRIAYITGSNPEVANLAERRRLTDLHKRRGVSLLARRQTPPFPPGSLEGCDAMFLIGGRATLATYAARRLPPVHHLPNSGFDVEPTDPARRDPRRFLFLGSRGQVHKGLDLLLEVFRDAPELGLTVCSRLDGEPDFLRAYRRELRLPNVSVAGFVDVRSGAFRDLQARCGALVLPSCAEGQAGTVSVAMGYGLPGLVSRECGFDDEELETLPDCRIPTLAAALRAFAAADPVTRAARAAATLARFRAGYRPGHYAAAAGHALDAVLAAAASRSPAR